MSSFDDETNVSQQDYQDAVNCIVYYESIIKTLKESIASKDKHINNLEDKVVKMSLELASSKAFEDMHRSKKRVSSCDDMSVDGNAEAFHPPPPSQSNKRMMGHVISMEGIVCNPTALNSKKTHSMGSSYQGAMGGSIKGMTSLNSISEREGMTLDGPPSSNRLSNFGQLFRRNISVASSVDTVSSSSGLPSFGQLFRGNCSQTKVDDANKQVQVREQSYDLERPQRRPPNRRMGNRASSRLHISGVLFPVNSEDCIQGCFGKKNSTLSKNEEWPEFR